jgi:hypothetical protein
MKIHSATIYNSTFANETDYSSSTDIRHMLGYVIELVYTGSSLAGSAKLQYSMDNSTFVDLPNSGATATHTLGAAGGTHTWYVVDAYYPYVRAALISSDADVVTATAKLFTKGV